MQFRILGPLEVEQDGRVLAITPGHQRALLALLIVNANTVLSPDRIVADVWGDELPGSGTKALAFHVSRLRASLAAGQPGDVASSCLATQPGGYVLRIDPQAIDAVRFERLAREAHERLAVDPTEAQAMLLQALALWHGDALMDVADAGFAQTEARRLEELRLEALEDRLEADLALGGHLAAIGELQALLERDPLRERLRGLLMLALYRAGRQAEALRVAGAGRRLLSEELGVDPSPELVRLETQMLTQDPALASPGGSRPAPRPRNPYKGLRAFGEADSADFFGREALVGRLVVRLEDALRADRFLLVAGPSGSGKSSVVRAGLVPALRARAVAESAGWRIATMVPGMSPFRELAAALRAAGVAATEGAEEAAEREGGLRRVVAGPADRATRTLLVIDQLEELFLRVDVAMRDLFLGGLLAALAESDAALVVVATMRADCLHLPLALGGIGELVRRSTELVAPLTRPELERAIVRPAEAVGVEVEPGLTAEIVGDVLRSPGALPLLEYALTELFERSDGRRLTREGYAAIGGVAGALERTADEAWTSLDPTRRLVAQQILLGLVSVDSDRVAVSRSVSRAALESMAVDPADTRVVLDELGRRGLLTFDADPSTGNPMVTIAHEALLERWPRLAGWIDDLRQDLSTRRRLAELSGEWDAAARSPGFLATGARLDRLESWARGTRLRLTEGERAYLAASSAERERLARVETERAARERGIERRARRVRTFLAAVLVLGLVLAGGLSAALIGARQAEAEGEAVARARQLATGSVAVLGTNRQLSILLALEAADATARRGYVVEAAYDALGWALQEAQVAYPADAGPTGIRPAPDGARGVYLESPDVLMRLGIEYIRRFRSSVALTPDECRIYGQARPCPPVDPPADGRTLLVRTVAGTQSAASLAGAGGGSGLRVRVLSELPASISTAMEWSLKGAAVTVEWDPAVGGDLAARIAGRDLPDVAIVSRPSYVRAAARDGWLVDLAGRVDTTALAAAGAYALGLGRVPGPGSGAAVGQYGLPIAASLSDVLWYPEQAFASSGYAVPSTMTSLTSLADRIRADGRTPWCLGMEAAAQSSGSAADWVEGLFLDAQGLARYDGWASGLERFGSADVRSALEATGELLGKPGAVAGGLASAARTAERYAALPMLLSQGPACWLYRGASTDRPTFAYGAAPRIGAVGFPGPTTGPTPVLGRLYMVVMLHDRPEVRRFVEALVSGPFQSAVAASLGGAGIFPVGAAAVPADDIAAEQGRRLRVGLDNGTFRVRVVDLVPAAVAEAFAGDVTTYLEMRSYFIAASGSTAMMDFAADAAWDALGRSGAP
ncbi:MAG TPA: BTAD domain-containing putative transcriptional regulator [Candidatus Limnocylindrales bacterium]